MVKAVIFIVMALVSWLFIMTLNNKFFSEDSTISSVLYLIAAFVYSIVVSNTCMKKNNLMLIRSSAFILFNIACFFVISIAWSR